jgi:serine protease Do
MYLGRVCAAFAALTLALACAAPASAVDRRRLLQADNWTVDEIQEAGRFSRCAALATYPNNEFVQLSMSDGDALIIGFGKAGGYRRGLRWNMVLTVDKVRIFDGTAEGTSEGDARISMPRTPVVVRELQEGKDLFVDWQRGTASGRMTYSLKGVRTVWPLLEQCVARNRAAPPQTREPEVAGSICRDGICDRDVIVGLQVALIWAGYYDGFVDGERGQGTKRAILKFQQDLRVDPTGDLTKAQVDRLLQLADAERERTGFKVYSEADTQIDIGLPFKYVSKRDRSQRGWSYVSPAGDIKIDTLRFQRGERTLDDLYDQLAKRGPIKKVGYTVKKTSEFVITGDDGEKRYYVRGIEDADGLRAFSVAHRFDSPVEMGRVIVAMANTFRATPATAQRPPQVPTPQPPTAQAPTRPAPDSQASPQRPDSVKSKGISQGTGFFVTAAGHIVTNEHVVKGCSGAAVLRVGEEPRPATILATDAKNDLALLKTELPATHVPRLRIGARVGEDVAVHGFPQAGTLSSAGNFTRGNLSAASGLHDDSTMMQITAPIQSGNSGGPVLDQSGNVIGVIKSRIVHEQAQNINFAIKASVAHSFLEANNVAVPLAEQASPQLANHEVADRAKAFTVLVVCR